MKQSNRRRLFVLVALVVGAFLLSLSFKSKDNPVGRTPDRRVAKLNGQMSVTNPFGGSDPSTSRGTYAYVVENDSRLKRGFKEILECSGAGFVGYLPPNGCIIEATPAVARRIRSLYGVRGVRRFNSSEKISPALAEKLNASGDAMVEVSVSLLNKADVKTVSEQIQSLGGNVLHTAACDVRYAFISAEVPPAAVASLQTFGEIKWMEPMSKKRLLNDAARRVMKVDGIVSDPVSAGGLGLTGAGQLVGHYDTGIDDTHPDFAGRVYFVTNRSDTVVSPDEIGHGTHTAGSILGSGAASDGKFAGVAPGAMLYHQQMAMFSLNIDDAYALFVESYEAGARIHSNSWGDYSHGQYVIDCQMVDLFHWKRPTFLALFSSGNDGVDADGDGVVDLCNDAAPSTSKNVLAVGATASERLYDVENSGMAPDLYYGNFNGRFPAEPIYSDAFCHDEIYSVTNGRGMASFSGRGPTIDGRIKPDICAPGTMVVSCRAEAADEANFYGIYVENGVTNTMYAYESGTSMACPLAAGAATLIREWLVGKGYEHASSALMRSMMIGGAHSLSPGQFGTGAFREIPEASPNPVEGWGEVDVRQTLAPENASVHLFDRVDDVFKRAVPADNWSAVFNVTNSSVPLVVTLAWIDYPAEPSSVCHGGALALVNDYDLVVTDPNGHEYRFNGGDHTNVQESVSIASPITGQWTVTVRADGVIDFSGGAAAVYARGAMELVQSDPVNNADTDEPVTPGDHIFFAQPMQSNIVPGADFVRVDVGEVLEFSATAFVGDSSEGIEYAWYFDGQLFTNGVGLTDLTIYPDDFVPPHDGSLKLSEAFTGEFAAFKRKWHYIYSVASIPNGGVTYSGQSFRFASDVHIRDNDDIDAFNEDQLVNIAGDPLFGAGDRMIFAAGVYKPVGVIADGIFFQNEPDAEVIIDGGGKERCFRLHPYFDNRGLPTVCRGIRFRNGNAIDPEEGSDERYGVWYMSRDLSIPWMQDENFYGSGGGVLNAVLVDCTIENCEAPNLGGGAYHCELYNCSIISNRTLSSAGTAADFCDAVYSTSFKYNNDRGGVSDDHAVIRNPRAIVDGLYDVGGEYWDVYADWTSHYGYLGGLDAPRVIGGTCSWSGGFAGRNLDCEEDGIYLLRLPKSEKLDCQYASVGVAIGPSYFDEDDPYAMPRFWRQMMWHTVDGINEAGVCVFTSVLEDDPAGPLSGSELADESSVDAAFVPRVVLSDTGSAAEAVEDVQSLDLYSDTGYTFQWTICDSNDCYVVKCGSEGPVVTKIDPDKGISSRMDMHDLLGNSRTPGATVCSFAYDLDRGELSVMMGNNQKPYTFSVAGGFGEWPYGDPTDTDSLGWADPVTRGGDILSALNDSGVFNGKCSYVDASGYARLVAWASKMGLSGRDIDELICGGCAPLTAAAFNNTDGFGRESDPDFEYVPRITEISKSPSSVTIKVSLGSADLLSADQSLLRAAIGITGSETLQGDFSDQDLEYEFVSITSDSAEIRITPPSEAADKYFIQTGVR